jgi:hypothetical protein
VSKFCVQAGWDHSPHLSEQAKNDLLAEIPPYQREARSKGTPTLGSGAIYPIAESDILIKPFELAEHWPRSYGLDVGWKRTAAVWSARDRDTDTVYLYAEHYGSGMDAAENARHIRAKGDWIPGVIDPASRGRSQVDGEQLIQNYRDQGLDIEAADNSVEAGIDIVWMRMVSGRLKVFHHLHNWLNEFRKYRRDDKGRIVKADDHLMDATRYNLVSGLDRAKTYIRKQYQPFRSSGRTFAG